MIAGRMGVVPTKYEVENMMVLVCMHILPVIKLFCGPVKLTFDRMKFTINHFLGLVCVYGCVCVCG